MENANEGTYRSSAGLFPWGRNNGTSVPNWLANFVTAGPSCTCFHAWNRWQSHVIERKTLAFLKVVWVDWVGASRFEARTLCNQQRNCLVRLRIRGENAFICLNTNKLSNILYQAGNALLFVGLLFYCLHVCVSKIYLLFFFILLICWGSIISCRY